MSPSANPAEEGRVNVIEFALTKYPNPTETLIDLFGGGDRERGGLFLVKRAKPGQLAAVALEPHALADHALQREAAP